MPIVINEIEIAVEVRPDALSQGSHGTTAIQHDPSKEAIIKECVEKVMEILNQKNER